MDICLINPPIEDFYSTSIRRQPLGLLYIMAALEKAGHRVSFINGHSPKSRGMPIPEEFGYLRPFMKAAGAERFPFSRYSHFGLSFQEMERLIRGVRARLFLVSSLFTTYHQEAARIIDIIRRTRPGAIIAAGGYHAALYPEYFLHDLGTDYVITGEGEESSVLLCRHLEGKIPADSVPGLAFRHDGETVRTPKIPLNDIDTLSFPARGFLKDRDFSMYGKRAAAMIASRGCPHSCDFCTGKAIWGPSYRPRNTGSIMDEIELCVREFRADLINFEDDNLLAMPARSRELLMALAALRKKMGVPLEFTAMNGLSIEHCDGSMMELLRNAGFREINLSLVTASRNLQLSHGRPFDSLRFTETAWAARRLGLGVRAYFILGLPDQSGDEIEDTIALLAESGARMFPSVYYNVESPKEQWKGQRSSAFFNETAHLSRMDLIRLFNRAMETNRR
jgi:radical SAM superfamily enzyme YgiQ (UPF0313 family)